MEACAEVRFTSFQQFFLLAEFSQQTPLTLSSTVSHLTRTYRVRVRNLPGEQNAISPVFLYYYYIGQLLGSIYAGSAYGYFCQLDDIT